MVKLPESYRTLGWAPLGGGLRRARVILNHQIALEDDWATRAPVPYLSRLARSLGFVPRYTVAMMTGAEVGRAGFATVRRRDLAVSAWCSAGCSNALRAGDRATALSRPLGTINLAIAVNQAVSDPALAEALQIAVEARVLALQVAQIASVRSGLPATGTGTDCVVVAAPQPTRHKSAAIAYCGKHTVLGEMVARGVLRSCGAALRRSFRNPQ
ncbi:MAG TPA: adenosylcobinamide amidohydrolase [Candidatus Binataceae bacterium]|nr:adenosylcobinamide amidohydrolase [Candidatus Binataceae bacterium]